VAVPRADQTRFAGDAGAHDAWQHALDAARTLGWRLVEIDLEPFLEAARLLYEGPWIAERDAALGALLARHADDVDPSVAAIVRTANGRTATESFLGLHRLAELRRATETTWQRAHALLVPTTPTIPTHAEEREDPLGTSAMLGTYTNFANLLDLCAIAVPCPTRPDGPPFGVSLLAPAGADPRLVELAAAWCGEPAPGAVGRVEVVVVGAHLSGQPLNGQLVELGGRLRRATRTAPRYRLYALAASGPAKPGMVRVPDGGAAIEVETWELDAAGLGALVASIDAPLGIGTVELADGTTAKGFLCEAHAIADARDITAYGGWRAYRAAAAGLRGGA
jgi:allophanate hydrolase